MSISYLIRPECRKVLVPPPVMSVLQGYVAVFPGQGLGQPGIAAKRSVVPAVTRQQPHVARVVGFRNYCNQSRIHGAGHRAVEEGVLVVSGFAQVVRDVERDQDDGPDQNENRQDPQHLQRRKRQKK